MIYVYCSKPSSSATDLAKALDGKRLRMFDGMDFWRRGKKVELKPGDVVIGWGSPFCEIEGVRVLNEGPQDQEKWMTRLGLHGVRTPRICAHNPEDPRYVPRKKGNKFSEDIANPPAHPDFWEEKLNLVNEYRVHSFDSRSIGSAKRVMREGMNAHPWIRTYELGWKLDYENFESTKELRALAHKAVQARGFVFGAVDIGEDAAGYRFVLGIDPAPPLGTEKAVGNYVKAINKWLENGTRTKEETPEEIEVRKMKKAMAIGNWVDPIEVWDRDLGPVKPRQRRPDAQTEDGMRVVNVRPPVPDQPRPSGTSGSSARSFTAKVRAGGVSLSQAVYGSAPTPVKRKPVAPPPMELPVTINWDDFQEMKRMIGEDDEFRGSVQPSGGVESGAGV